MKNFLKHGVLAIMMLIAQQIFSQTPTSGDYRSVTNGNWSSTSTWQKRDASGNWSTPATAPTATNNVYIQAGHQVIVDVATANCNDLHLQTTDSLGIGDNTLQVSGKIRSYNSYQITTGVLSSNVVTITTSAVHGLSAGNSVVISGLSGTLAPVNGTFTIASVPTSTTFTYSLTNANITSTTSGTTTGSVTKSGIVVTGSTDGVFYSQQVNSVAVNTKMCASNAGVGSLKFIGTKRNITSTGEWTGNSINFPADINFAFASSADTGFINTVFGGRNIIFSSGVTAVTGNFRFTPSGGGAGTGTVTIKNGASFTSAVSGTTQCLARTSTSTFGTLTIEAGGTLELTGGTPTIDVHTIVNNGNVVYNRAGVQTLLAKGASTDVSPNNSIDFTSYNNLTIKTTGAKTIPAGVAINVSGSFTLGSTASSCVLAAGDVNSILTYGSGATLVLGGAQSIALNSASLEWPSSNGPTNVTVLSNILSFTAPTVSNVQLTSNVATITTVSTHGLLAGQTVTLANVSVNGSVFNGTYTIASVPSTTTFTFAKTNTDITSVGASGNVTQNISRTVTGTMTLNGGSFSVGFGNTLTFANGSTIARGGTTNALSISSGTINFGTSASDVINVSILPSSAITASNELVATPTGTYGTLTIGSGSTYTMTSGRTITNLANSGVLSLTPTTSFTFTVTGNLSGSGTITGHDSASLSFDGSGSGSAGTLNFTSGAEKMNNLTVNRTGTNGSVAIGQAVTINRNITLTAGILTGGTNVITLRGGISGAGTYTAGTGGKIVLNGTTNSGTLTIGSVTLANIEMGANGYSLAGSPVIKDTLDLKTYTLRTATGTVIMNAGATLKRTSGWVFGSLRKNIATGTNVTRTFEVGDSLNSTPVNLIFASVTTAGDVTVKSVVGAANVANYDSVPLSKSNYVNRYWTISNVNTLAYTNYNAIFNYISGDLKGNATPGSVIGAKYGSSWVTYATTAGTNADTIKNLTGTGNFLLGECGSLVTPSVSISTSSTIVCSNDAVTFNATGTNPGNSPVYQWKKNGANAGTGNSITFAPNTLANGDTITCVLTANNLCQTTNTATSNAITMTVNQSPVSATIYNGTTGVAIAGNAVVYCNIGTQYPFYVDKNYRYGTWTVTNPSVVTLNNGSSTSGLSSSGDIKTLQNGTATIRYTLPSTTQGNGCTTSVDIAVTVAKQSTPDAVTGSTSVCPGDVRTYSTTSTGGVWSINGSRGTITTGGVATYTSAGNTGIEYKITNGSNCSASYVLPVTVNATPAVPNISYGAGNTVNPQAPGGGLCRNRTFNVQGSAANGVWSSTGVLGVTPVGIQSTTATISTGSITGVGTISYEVTNSAGCKNIRTMSFNVVACASKGISSQQSADNSFTVYPNPAHNVISVKAERLTGGTIIVTDLYGRQIKQQPIGLTANTIDVTNFARGVYFVSIVTEQGKQTQKVVVQ